MRVSLTRRPGRAAITLVGAVALTIGGLAMVPEAAGAADGLSTKPNVLLVHGAFADGSSWSNVIARLQRDGYHVTASQTPNTSFADDVAVVQRDLRVLHGPTLIAAHSYGGAVISQAAEGAANVVGLVYLAAFAPDTGETLNYINNTLAPLLPSQADAVPIDLPNVGANNAPFLMIRENRFRDDFCADCSRVEAAILAAAQTPLNASATTAPLQGTPAWKQVPSWYQISAEDRLINPAAQKIMAGRLDPTGSHTLTLESSHASLVSHAGQVAQFIERAATNCSPTASPCHRKQ
ncbi:MULTISPECIES: alpha/beta hydrolase [unclassified Frankia]|uniref:alpha/beta hydrolase n=1 Tax=unclassified Frankia TaxID=2632575 RepID=UPI002AD4EC20|nr:MULTISPECIES: alpha/beta hydrolase [unclassified Frankia]